MKFLQLIVVLSVLIVTSCTVQKRRFNKGWNVEWNAKQHTSKSNSSKETVRDLASLSSSTEVISNNATSNAIVDGTESSELIRFSNEPIVTEIVSENTPVVAPSSSLKSRVLHQLVKPKKPKLGKKNERTPAGKVNFILGPASVALIGGGWVLYFIYLALGISSNIWIPFVLVGFLGAIGTLIFATRAERQIAAAPGKFNPFTGKNWAYIAFGVIVLGLICGTFIR